MTKILITGVAGFLGSRFAEWLLRNVSGATVYGLDDLSCGYPESVPKGVRWDKCDLSQGIHATFPEVDYIFHFAAYAAEGLSPFIRSYNYRNNLLATANVVNLAVEREVKRLVFTSSMAAYGRPLWPDYDRVLQPVDPPFDEDYLCNPIDPYGIAKLACERDIQCAGEMFGLDWCIIRPHNLYGPGQSIWQKYRNVLGVWMSRAFQGEPLLVYGDGAQWRAFSFVDDCLPCLWEAAVRKEASREIINLGGEKPIQILKAANLVADILRAKVSYAPARYEVKNAWCTVEKSQRLLNYVETVPFVDGVERMAAWAKEAWRNYPERRKQRTVSAVEIRRGLYPQWAELLGEPNTPRR